MLEIAQLISLCFCNSLCLRVWQQLWSRNKAAIDSMKILWYCKIKKNQYLEIIIRRFYQKKCRKTQKVVQVFLIFAGDNAPCTLITCYHANSSRFRVWITQTPPWIFLCETIKSFINWNLKSIFSSYVEVLEAV